MFNKKGFTLIELLVVIAIIGILASIVLVSFPSANNKAKDSRTIGAMAQIRTIMTYYSSNNGDSYVGFACTNAEMTKLCDDILLNSGVALTITPLAADPTRMCISAPMKAKAGTFYCADSTGFTTTTYEACDVATGRCPL